MKLNPGLYNFIWYESKETTKKSGRINQSHHMKRWTYTLALSADNAIENTLRLARSSEDYDNLLFTYKKVSIMLMLYALITRNATHTIYNVFGPDWSDYIKYVPAKDKYL